MFTQLACRLGLLVSLLSLVAAEPTSKPSKPSKESKDFPVLQYKLKDLKGKEIDLMQYKGKVLLIVPVAWDDRNRREFADLKLVADHYRESGFVLVAVLTNSFTKEVKSDAELAKSIEDRYGISYILAASVETKGESIHPLFKYLTDTARGEELGGELVGPFTKFLISRDGEVARRFAPGKRLQREDFSGPIWAELEKPMTK